MTPKANDIQVKFRVGPMQVQRIALLH